MGESPLPDNSHSQHGTNHDSGRIFQGHFGACMKTSSDSGRSEKSAQKKSKTPQEEQASYSRARGDIPPGAVASIISGIVIMIFLALPFYTTSMNNPDLGRIIVSLSGYDLALGTVNFRGTQVSIGTFFPTAWLIAAGAILAVILGVVAVLNYSGESENPPKPLAKKIGVIILIAGVLALAGCAITLSQLVLVSGHLSILGTTISASPDVGIIGALPMSAILVLEGLRMTRAGG